MLVVVPQPGVSSTPLMHCSALHPPDQSVICVSKLAALQVESRRVAGAATSTEYQTSGLVCAAPPQVAVGWYRAATVLPLTEAPQDTAIADGQMSFTDTGEGDVEGAGRGTRGIRLGDLLGLGDREAERLADGEEETASHCTSNENVPTADL